VTDSTSEHRTDQGSDASERDARGEERRRNIRSSVQGWDAGGGFFESTIAGFIVGYGLDRWLDTEPWFVVVGIVVGSISGFLRVWQYAKREINPRER
jgi:F0F1-type ATP synthase assembly protein I